MTSWVDDPVLLGTFRAEVSERLASLSSGLLSLEARPDDADVLAAIFRDAHTLKGSARMMGFVAIKEVAHRMEDILGDIKEGRLRMGSEVADVLLAAVDLIPQLVGEEAVGDDLPAEAVAMVSRLEAARAGAVAEAEAAEANASVAVEPLELGEPSTPRQTWEGDDGLPAVGSIRIDTAKVYDLIDLVGEANVAHVRSAESLRSMSAVLRDLDKRLRRLRDGHPGRAEEMQEAMALALARLAVLADDMGESMSASGRGLGRLQEQSMRLAMQPTSSIFAPFPRVVRELCRDVGKEVDLHMDGGGTELDKQVLERIVDPIRHLLINAVDHGIEPPDERAAAGKPRRGNVFLRARQQGRQVVIEISDDGRGIDADEVRDTARRRGLVGPDEELADADALALLFHAGFSTSRMVTDLSGRGVGLDVVKTAVDQLKGAVEIESAPGFGTRFLVTLPITLAIVEGVMVTCSGQTFAIPVGAVEEVVAVPAHEVSRTNGRETAILRGHTTPIVPLTRVLGLPEDEQRYGPVVVLATGTRRVAFRVGSVSGQREVVIKGLGSFLPRVRHVAGATISGDGSVLLVLDPYELVDAARRAGAPGPEAPPAPESPLRLLVVDDSLAIREMNRSILETAGYTVETANDGLDALARLAEGGFDGVVTDVEMPRMGGFDLTARIRAQPGFEHLPVIILTSLAKEDDRRRGLDVGADAYLTKSGFDQTILLEVIEGLVKAGRR